MTQPDSKDVRRSLEALDDDEAIAIMEGRHPASDAPELDEAALTIARGLLAEESATTGSKAGGGSVVQLIGRQPWMKMAAAMVFGVLVSTLVTVDVSVDGETSMASANVVYLETYRSADPVPLPVVSISGTEPWVTLIAYPDFTNADRFQIEVERAVPDSDGEWVSVLRMSSGVGNGDSIAVNIPAELLTEGAYRLRIGSKAGVPVSPGFRVER